MKEKLQIFIKNNYEKHNNFFGSIFNQKKQSISYNEEICFDCCEEAVARASSCDGKSVDNFININKDNNSFQQLLFKYIDERNLKDSDVYNKVHIDRRLFSKIRSDENYHPSKETIILLGLSLKLNEKEFDKLLSSASYTLAKNNYYDLIIRFCFIEGIYKISDVNDLLDSYNCKLFNY